MVTFGSFLPILSLRVPSGTALKVQPGSPSKVMVALGAARIGVLLSVTFDGSESMAGSLVLRFSGTARIAFSKSILKIGESLFVPSVGTLV